jgi:hypothetical protein
MFGSMRSFRAGRSEGVPLVDPSTVKACTICLEKSRYLSRIHTTAPCSIGSKPASDLTNVGLLRMYMTTYIIQQACIRNRRVETNVQLICEEAFRYNETMYHGRVREM